MTSHATYAAVMAALTLWCIASGLALGWHAERAGWPLRVFLAATLALMAVNAAAGTAIVRAMSP